MLPRRGRLYIPPSFRAGLGGVAGRGYGTSSGKRSVTRMVLRVFFLPGIGEDLARASGRRRSCFW